MKVPDLEDSDTSLASESIEAPLCTYLQQFDGSVKDFGNIRSRFNALFSDNFIYCVDGKSMNRQAFINMNKYLLENRMIATLEDIYFRDDTHLEYTVNWGNDNISMVTHVTGLVGDEGKLIKLEPCPETSGVFANMMGPTWTKAIALSVDRRILDMKQWAFTQRIPRTAWMSQRTSGPIEI